MADRPPNHDTQMADPLRYPGTPRWVKVFGIIVIVVALLFVVAMMVAGGGGEHAPGRHDQSGDAGTSLASVPEGHTPPTGAHTQA